MQKHAQRPTASGPFRWLGAGCVLCVLGVLVLAGSRGLARQDATPVPTSCGEPVSMWGDASTNDVTITLALPSTTPASPVASPVAEPVNPGKEAFLIRFANHGTETATVRVPDIQATLCDGTSIAPDASAFAEPEVTIPAGEAVEISVVFSHDPAIPAQTLIVPVSTESLTAGRVEFVLRLLPTSSGSGENVTGADAYGGDGAAGQDASDATPAGGT